MKMENHNLLIGIDGSIKDTNKINHRWHLTYAHGELESEYGFDIVIFNKPEPTKECYYIAYTEESIAVIIHLVASENGYLQGRCCYLDDYEALKHINDPASWA